MAALEFALSITVMLMVVVGIVGFGALFWAQQKLSKAAGEGAQAALYASLTGQAVTPEQLQPLLQTAACTAVQREANLLIPSGSTALASGSGCSVQTALCSALPNGWSPAAGDAPAMCASVNLQYSLSNWPLVSLMATLAGSPLFRGANWFPTQLAAQAVVQVTPSAVQSASSS
ncbi:MAG TPA: TadE/TadG family type IV pilus assembly protein [Bordetella sp.]